MKIILYVFVSYWFLLYSCSKKNIEIPPEKEEKVAPNFNCKEIPEIQGISTGWNFLLSDNAYFSPHFNPKNGNEFAFMLKNNKTGLKEIYTYDINTKTKSLIYTGKTHNHIEWAADDWIFFNKEVLYKIKSDGTELAKVTKIKFVFTTQNNKILYESVNSTPSNLMFYFSDLDNNILDSVSIFNSGGPPEWSGENVVFMPNIYNTNSKVSKVCLEDYELHNVIYKKFVNTEEFIWSDLLNVYKTNINTNITDTLISHCNAYQYGSFDYSPHTNKVLCHRSTKERIADGLLKIDSYIVLMNPDGTEKEIIDIDNEF